MGLGLIIVIGSHNTLDEAHADVSTMHCTLITNQELTLPPSRLPVGMYR